MTLTKLTKAQAARAARVSRSTIWRAVRDGRLSVMNDERNEMIGELHPTNVMS